MLQNDFVVGWGPIYYIRKVPKDFTLPPLVQAPPNFLLPKSPQNLNNGSKIVRIICLLKKKKLPKKNSSLKIKTNLNKRTKHVWKHMFRNTYIVLLFHVHTSMSHIKIFQIKHKCFLSGTFCKMKITTQIIFTHNTRATFYVKGDC